MITTMASILKFVLYVCAVFAVKSAPTLEKEGTELVLVNVIFRHGARTTYAFYPTDPNQNETFYPIGLGGLTNDGKLGEYKLGRYLKNLYGDFLGDVYTEELVEVRSTDVTRTKMSALLVLAGLFPPNRIQQWNEDLMWQPIPVAYKSEVEEDIFHPWKACPFKAAFIDNMPDIEEVKELFIKPFNETFNYVEENSGKPIRHPADMQDIFFILKTEADMGLVTPEWANSIFPEPAQTISGHSYAYHNYDHRVKLINVGYMLRKILDDSRKKIQGESTKRIHLYSGHESTLGYMLDALKVSGIHVPPYGSAISFELHKANEEYFVKLRYRNDTDATEPLELEIPGCGFLCPLDVFIDLQKDLIPTLSMKEACEQLEKKEVDVAPPTNSL